MTLAELVALLRRMDDGAWAALANRGLLRRATKDLDNLEVELVGEGPVVVRVGEHAVTFGASFPQDARCSCPATTLCQHVITGGLWLPRLPADEPRVGVPDGADLHAELMAIDPETFLRFAGRAALRWAVQFIDDLGPGIPAITKGAQIQIRFTQPRITFRYVGGGLSGLIPDTKLPAPEKYAVAAALAYQSAHGAEPLTLEPVRARKTATIEAQVGSRERLLRVARGLLLDTVRLGASHPSPALLERYQTTAVWAQGAELHRLSLLLRRLADQIELLLQRNVRADEHALLDDVALAHALVCALEQASSVSQPQPRLAGRARTAYDPVRSMELVGVGGWPWHAASGYRGLTCLFWWPEEHRFLSWTDARPDTMGFDARARYTQPGPWTGLESPSLATGSRITLSDALVSADGRISGVERTRALLRPADAAAVTGLPVIHEWSAIDDRALGAVSLLDPPDPLRRWVVLRPAAAEPALFDPIRQIVRMVIEDRVGAPLALSMRWTRDNAAAVQRLEQLTIEELTDGVLVVVRLTTRSGTLSGEPLSIVHPDGRVDSLHFDLGATGETPTGRPAPPAEAGVEDAAGLFPPGLHDLRAWLLAQMERGSAASDHAALLRDLDRRHQDARGLGFTAFPLVPPGTDPAQAMARSLYLVLQLAALAG